MIKGLLGFYVLVPAAAFLAWVAPEAAISGVVRGVLAGSGGGLTVLLLFMAFIAIWPAPFARLLGAPTEGSEAADAPGRPRGGIAGWLLRTTRTTAQDLARFLRGPRWAVIGCLLVTLLNLAILATTAFIMALGLAPGLPPGPLWTLSVLWVVLVFIAPTPGGAGVAEGGGLLIFAPLLGEARAAALVVLWRAISCYAPFLLGALVFGAELSRSRRGRSARR